MTKNLISRLISNNWRQSITTSTHDLYFKRDWMCAIDRITGEVKFKRRRVLPNVYREVERGIE